MSLDPYPTEEELKKIETWEGDRAGLMEYVKSLWWCADWGWHQDGVNYIISTGGWSGNEDIIDAMQHNLLFWTMCYQSSRAGGHWFFNIAQELMPICGVCDGTGYRWKKRRKKKAAKRG